MSALAHSVRALCRSGVVWTCTTWSLDARIRTVRAATSARALRLADEGVLG